MSMVDQYTPYGSLTYTPLGDDRYRADVQLSPDEAHLNRLANVFEAGLGQLGVDQLGRVYQAMAQPFDQGQFQQAGGVIRAMPSQYEMIGYANAPQQRDADQVRQAMIDRNQGNLDAQRQQMQTSLLNRGIAEGSQAWTRAMDDWNRQQNDLMLGATLAAGQEQSRMFGDDLQAAVFQNQMRGQQYGEHTANLQYQQGIQDRLTAERQRQMQEATYLRQLPLNEATALMSGVQVQAPQFQSMPQVNVGAAPIMDATYGSYQGQMNAWQQQQQQRGGFMQGLMGLGGTLAGAGIMKYSDMRLKTDIRRLGGTLAGLPLYSYRYRWGGPQQVGVMAQDVLGAYPDAVSLVGDYYAVDYGKLLCL